MPLPIDSPNCSTSCDGSAASLNRSCFCRTLDQTRLLQSFTRNSLQRDLLASHPFLFANTAVFISPEDYNQMQAIISAIEALARTAVYREQAMARADNALLQDRGTHGVFMGYDFHLSPSGPQLIEINTNAGGGFLNAALVGAQKACCAPMANVTANMEQQFVDMFLSEWRQQKADAPLRSLAIVDDHPQQQFLFPEFQLAQALFVQAGIDAHIVDAKDLQLQRGQLVYQNQIIDLVYNRLTDFYLNESHHQVLRQAMRDGAVVMTPDPFHYALYADKRNLPLMTNSAFVNSSGIADNHRCALSKGIPTTHIVTASNSDQLWRARRDYFFKPATGFGSRAAYRGDKLTKRVWQEITTNSYVAQQLITPSQRFVMVDDERVPLKLDLRAYAYQGRIQLIAARLYQGQTTNLRTPGGGFAPVFVADRSDP